MRRVKNLESAEGWKSAAGWAGETPLDGVDRRGFLRAGALSAAGMLCGLDRPGAAMPNDDFAGGKFLGLEPFVDEGLAPVNEPIATELDGRLYTDLTRVTRARQITPTSEFYIRTAASRLLPAASGWKIGVDGMVSGEPAPLDLPTLRAMAKPMGTHLMECAGNVKLTRFGLISVAGWSGVPIAAVLDRLKIKPGTTAVEISGFDNYAGPTMTSVPGASWIFPISELTGAGAFLATEMNGQALNADHGAPVRLMVPGWYGCSSIKWVNRISLVDDSAEATSQMQEYAVRILQEGKPRLAREFEPARVDHAAMPVRVEKWMVNGKLKYRVTGVQWGGSEMVRTLQIRFNPDEDFVAVKEFRQVKVDPWTLWSHTWMPKTPGTYLIRLAITDPPVRARKLDMGLYVRSVRIREVGAA